MKFIDIKNYFEDIATNHVDIKQFHHGQALEIIERKQEVFEYPLFWLETPDTNFTDYESSNITTRKKIAFVIFTKYENGDYKDRDLKLQICEDILLDVIALINMQKKKGNKTAQYFQLNTANYQAIASLFNDIETGWRLEMDFETPEDLCYNPDKFSKVMI